MTINGQKNQNIIALRQRMPVYAKNPSVPEARSSGRMKKIQLGNDRQGIIIAEDTGEILGHGGAAFYQWEEIDNEKFVKIYLEGIRKAVGLTKAGLMIFEVVYGMILKKPNEDTVILNHFVASQHIDGLTQRTYNRGLRELVEKEFLFQNPSEGVYFVNIAYMFKGDRLAFVKGYTRKKPVL